MATERKRRDDKDRHEFAWNPDYGWQILRRCPNYRIAVAQFLKEAERAGDTFGLKAYKASSLDEAPYDDKQKYRARYVPSWARRRRGSKSRKEVLRDQDEAFHFPMVPNPNWRRYEIDDAVPRHFEVDVTTKHYRKFFEWYGDLILFPINPDCVRPRVSALSALWALYSVKVRRENNDLADFNLENDRLINISLTINTSFSKSMIEDDLRWFLKSKLDGQAPIKEKPRWSVEQFSGYLGVLDAVYPAGKKTKISHRTVGENYAPKYVKLKVNSDRAVIDWAKDTRKYVETKLLPLFNKPKPTQTKRMRY